MKWLVNCYSKYHHGVDLSVLEEMEVEYTINHIIKCVRERERVRKQDYCLELYQELNMIHNAFHVCYLRKWLGNEVGLLTLDEIQIENKCIIEEY